RVESRQTPRPLREGIVFGADAYRSKLLRAELEDTPRKLPPPEVLRARSRSPLSTPLLVCRGADRTASTPTRCTMRVVLLLLCVAALTLSAGTALAQPPRTPLAGLPP